MITPSPETLMEMVKTELLKWEGFHLNVEDVSIGYNDVVQSVIIKETGYVAARLLLRNDELTQIIYPSLMLN